MEQKIRTGQSEKCPTCLVPRGTPHNPGCFEEECPQCHKFIIGCDCLCLSDHDGSLIIQELYRQFSDINQALQATRTKKDKKSNSYLEHAAMQYMFEKIDTKSQEELSRNLHTSFPALKPTLYDKDGIGYYTAEQLAKAFGITINEIK